MALTRAGAASVDITPAAGCSLAGFAARTEPATGVHDPLTAQAVAVADDAAASLVVVADLIALDAGTAAAVADRVEARTGVPARHVAVAVTHTHGGPAVTRAGIGGFTEPAYVAEVVHGMAEAAALAYERLRPATVSAGHADLTGIACNRRGGDLTDTCVPVIRLDGADGTPIATVFSYACHPVTLGPDNREVTADWPGYARREVAAALGGVPVFLQGCAGQLNTGHLATASYTASGGAHRTFAEAERIGGEVARAVVGAVRSLAPALAPAGERGASAGREAVTEDGPPAGSSPAAGSEHAGRRDDGPVRVAAIDLDLPLGPPDPTETLRARAAEWQRAAEGADPGEQGVLACWSRWADTCLREPAAAAVRVRAAAHRWGPARLLFLPGEPFVELALELREALAEPGLLVAGYTGGVPGYLPYPPTEYRDGGYEVTEAHRAYGQPAALAPDAGPRVRAAALELAGAVDGPAASAADGTMGSGV